MLLGTARAVGESYLDPDARALKMLGYAISLRNIGRFEIAFDTDTNRMDGPCPRLMVREIGDHCIYKLLCKG